jgi:hypothetical protein
MTDKQKIFEAGERVKSALQQNVEAGSMHPAVAQMHETIIGAIKRAINGGADPVAVVAGLIVEAKALREAAIEQAIDLIRREASKHAGNASNA